MSTPNPVQPGDNGSPAPTAGEPSVSKNTPLNRTAQIRRAVIRLSLEMGLYALLVVIYLYLILRFFGDELVRLFHSNPPFYAVLALTLMVVQGLFLESVTTYLIDRLQI